MCISNDIEVLKRKSYF